MPLEFNVNIVPAKHGAKLLHAVGGRFDPSSRQEIRQGALFTARQADQPVRLRRHLLRKSMPLGFFEVGTC